MGEICVRSEFHTFLPLEKQNGSTMDEPSSQVSWCECYACQGRDGPVIKYPADRECHKVNARSFHSTIARASTGGEL